jgi:adenylate cyclase
VLKRKLVTILSADVAEYSRLMAEDEEQTLRLFREHSETFRVLVDSHHGRIFNTAGDAILAEFTSPVEAVRCATDIQSALRTRNDQFPLSRQVRFRIGVNLGDVMIQNTDLLGDGVNVAARLQSAAPPGGVCISGSVHEQIRNKLSLGFELLGELRFKNIPQTVRTFTISGTNDGGQSPPPKAASKPSGLWLKATVAALSLVILAGGYWAYATRQQSPATLLRTAPAAVGPSATVKPVDTKAAIVPAAANTAVAPAAATQAAPVQSASSDLSSLMRREQAASNKCEDGSGDLDETGRACAERDRLVEVLADKGWCHLTSWQRCAR